MWKISDWKLFRGDMIWLGMERKWKMARTVECRVVEGKDVVVHLVHPGDVLKRVGEWSWWQKNKDQFLRVWASVATLVAITLAVLLLLTSGCNSVGTKGSGPMTKLGPNEPLSAQNKQSTAPVDTNSALPSVPTMPSGTGADTPSPQPKASDAQKLEPIPTSSMSSSPALPTITLSQVFKVDADNDHDGRKILQSFSDGSMLVRVYLYEEGNADNKIAIEGRVQQCNIGKFLTEGTYNHLNSELFIGMPKIVKYNGHDYWTFRFRWIAYN